MNLAANSLLPGSLHPQMGCGRCWRTHCRETLIAYPLGSNSTPAWGCQTSLLFCCVPCRGVGRRLPVSGSAWRVGFCCLSYWFSCHLILSECCSSALESFPPALSLLTGNGAQTPSERASGSHKAPLPPTAFVHEQQVLQTHPSDTSEPLHQQFPDGCFAGFLQLLCFPSAFSLPLRLPFISPSFPSCPGLL